MSDGGADDKKYTQAEVDALIQERNAALEAKRDEILTELKDAKTKLKGFDGVDPDEHATLKQKVAELEQAASADKAGITEEQLKGLRADVEKTIVERFAKMDPATLAEHLPSVANVVKDNRSLRLDSKVKAEMGTAGVRTERVDALFRLTAGDFELTDDGQPMVKTQPGLEVARYVSENLKEQYPEFFNGSGSSGGGASKSAAGGGGSPKTIAATDGEAFINNLEGIAKGTVQVQQ